MKSLPLFILVAGLCVTSSFSQEEPEADPNEMPRVPATEPDKAIDTFEVRPGFKMELAAHEPLVEDPIDITFDEHGRMFVVEMRGYSEHREDALGRIRLLIDENDDGVFDKSTVYAKGLKWPTSVCCYDGGVFVIASPDILYFKDTSGDGVSDVSETVFTGFGNGKDRLNMQALVNSLTWGPDHRIWGATASNGGTVRRPDQPESEALNLNGSDFSFDPKTRELRAENGTAQFGMSFDSFGRRFVCSNSNHIRWVAWERDWIQPNPYFSMPAPIPTIADDGGSAPVFRISPDEPWRIVRTRWRVSGVVKGSVEGGGRVSGYFTAATGITIYTGDAYGEEFHNNAFIGDAGSNLVHRKVIINKESAVQPIATRADDEKDIEFVRSRDNWFRPVNFANGPDGCLYICDMYRETIEHPWSIPEGIKKYVDLDSGNNRGRIWRVVPEGFERKPTPVFTEMADDKISRIAVGKRDTWKERTARRLVAERGLEPPLTRPFDANEFFSTAIAWQKKDWAEKRGGEKSDPWLDARQLNKLDSAGRMRTEWKALAERNRNPEFKAKLAEMIGKTGDLPTIQLVLDDIVTRGVSKDSSSLLAALGDGLRSAKLTIAKVDSEERLSPIFGEAWKTAANTGTSPAARAESLNLLRFDSIEKTTSLMHRIVAESSAPDSLRQLAIRGASARSGDLASVLLAQWKDFSPALRTTALEAFASSADRAKALLAAIDSSQIPSSDIPANTAELLRSHRDGKVKKLAARVLPAPEIVDRETIVKRYQASLKLTGDAERGKAAFAKGACITCHKTPDGQGMAVGPDVATFKTAGADSILKNLFDPNAEVAPQYQAFSFNLHGGEAVVGIIAQEDATQVTIRMPGGLEKTFPRKEVAGMKGLGRSLMPEGLEAALNEQEVADLLAYIAAAK